MRDTHAMSQASRQRRRRRRRRLHCKKRLGQLANRKQLQLQHCSSVLLQCMQSEREIEREGEQSQAFDSISQWAHLAAAAAALLIMSMTYE